MNEITIDDLETLQNPLFVDIREQEEWDMGHIDGAEHIALSALLQGKQVELPHDRPIVIYCRSGVRSLQALDVLHASGQDNLVSLQGGYEAFYQKYAG